VKLFFIADWLLAGVVKYRKFIRDSETSPPSKLAQVNSPFKGTTGRRHDSFIWRFNIDRKPPFSDDIAAISQGTTRSASLPINSNRHAGSRKETAKYFCPPIYRAHLLPANSSVLSHRAASLSRDSRISTITPAFENVQWPARRRLLHGRSLTVPCYM